MLKAVVYDFDGTLTPDMQPEFKILEMSGMENGVNNPKFLQLAQEIMQKKGTDIYEAIILAILDVVRKAGFELNDKNIGIGAYERIYNPGVEDFLQYLRERGVKNYILSSGSKSYLDQIKLAPYFDEIYASTLSYNKNGIVNGVEQVMTDVAKTETLKQIALKINGNTHDLSDIVYIGDGPTDFPAMDYIKEHGGKAILVRCDDNHAGKLQTNNIQVDFATKADFTNSSQLTSYMNDLLLEP